MKNYLISIFILLSIFSCKKDDGSQATKNRTDFKVSSIGMTCFVDGDALSEPDVYLIIKKGSTVIHTTGYAPDTYNFDFQISGLILKQEVYTIEFWDFDTLDDDDYLGSLAIAITGDKNSFYQSNSVGSILVDGSWE